MVVLATQVPSQLRFFKATRVNGDVAICASEIASHTPEGQIVATLTDVSRFNSLAYYSDRLGVNVESVIYPVARYRRAGATRLAVNLSASQFSGYESWLREARLLWIGRDLPDFKGRERACAVYDIS